MENKKIYISYAWGDILEYKELAKKSQQMQEDADNSNIEKQLISHEREAIVDDIEKRLTTNNFELVRDKRIKNAYSITELMNKIGAADYVIIVLSEKFFSESFYTPMEINLRMQRIIEKGKHTFTVFTENFTRDYFENNINTITESAKNNIEKHIQEQYCIQHSNLKFKDKVLKFLDKDHKCYKDKKSKDAAIKYETSIACVQTYIDNVAKLGGDVVNPQHVSFQHDKLDDLIAKIQETNDPHFGISGVNSSIIPSEPDAYHKYLLEEHNPYISRQEFNSSSKTKKNITDEDTIYSKAFGGYLDDVDGIFIYGEGGIGKTRLMNKLAEKARADDWIIKTLTRGLRDIKDLKLKPEKEYCLLVDYVEEVGVFTVNKIFEDITDCFPSVKIRIIVNSRRSYFENVRNDISGKFFQFEVVVDDDEDGYYQYVLNTLKNRDEEEIPSWVGKPSFYFFYKDHRKKFESQEFLQITGFSDFIRKSIRRSVEAETLVDDIFGIFASLPLPIEAEHKYTEKQEEFLKKLVADGFISRRSEYRPSHNDTIADALISLYLGEGVTKNDISFLFNFAKEYSNFFNAFNALNKIGNVFQDDVEKTEILLQSLEDFLEEIKKDTATFVKSTLLKNYEKLYFISTHELLEPADSDYMFTLLKVMENTELDQTKKDKAKGWFVKCFNKDNDNQGYFNDTDWGSALISSVYSFFPIETINNFQDIIDINAKACQWINTKYNHGRADTVMKWYLEQESEKNIKDSLTIWKKNKNFAAIAKVYFKSAGKIAYIEDFIITLNNFRKHNYSSLIRGYLEYGGDLEKIEYPIMEWLKHFLPDQERNRNNYNQKADMDRTIYIEKIMWAAYDRKNEDDRLFINICTMIVQNAKKYEVARAQYCYGKMLHFGRGVNKNLEKALEVIKKAATKDPAARRYLTWNEYLSNPNIPDVGEKIEGNIPNIAGRGLFVTIAPGIDGYVHQSDIDWRDIKPGRSGFREDQSVKVTVKSIKKEDHFIDLCIEPQIKAWKYFEEDYPVGTEISVTVDTFNGYGYFVSLPGEYDHDIQGMLHQNNIPNNVDVKKGQNLKVKILSIDIEEKRTSLGYIVEDEKDAKK